jgi:23S rRNA pseudouridine2457 synthase
MTDTIPSHFKAYKPYGMLSQMGSNDLKEARSKRFLSELYDFPAGTMPIGRLDENSEGLLLLTTNGKLSDTINRSGIEKEYYAQLDGEITDDALRQITMGVEIGFDGKKYPAKAVAVKKLRMPPNFPEANRKIRLGRHRPTSWIGITLTVGKFRQVRKMTAAVGFPTLRLVRVRIGLITLDGLAPGNVQLLQALNF